MAEKGRGGSTDQGHIAYSAEKSAGRRDFAELPREDASMLGRICEYMDVGLAYMASDGRWLRVNGKLQEIVGYSEEELLGMSFQQMTHVDDLAADTDALRRLHSGEATEDIREKRYLRKDGQAVWVKVTSVPMRDARDEFNFISVIEDISSRRRMEAALHHQINHDALTGLPNRTLLHDRLAQTMYHAKETGRGNFQFYVREMNARTLDRLKIEVGLRHALHRGEFALHYQPQIDVASGRVVGVEALLRWMHPEKCVVPPSEFIPIAEETGLIMPIGEWVLQAACAQQQEWEEQGFGRIKVAVNLSARQFQQKDLDRMIACVLEHTGCPADCLTLEITESVVMENPEAATLTLKKLSNMGVRLAIDDFGTGYSSLSYLKRFPIDELKIDRSFVTDITTDADDAAIAKAVIVLAHSMKLDVTAEGVETARQLEFLRQQQCDLMQGHYFSKPLPADWMPVLMTMKPRNGM
jgi:PAS domain S-box-containing protein